MRVGIWLTFVMAVQPVHLVFAQAPEASAEVSFEAVDSAGAADSDDSIPVVIKKGPAQKDALVGEFLNAEVSGLTSSQGDEIKAAGPTEKLQSRSAMAGFDIGGKFASTGLNPSGTTSYWNKSPSISGMELGPHLSLTGVQFGLLGGGSKPLSERISQLRSSVRSYAIGLVSGGHKSSESDLSDEEKKRLEVALLKVRPQLDKAEAELTRLSKETSGTDGADELFMEGKADLYGPGLGTSNDPESESEYSSQIRGRTFGTVRAQASASIGRALMSSDGSNGCGFLVAGTAKAEGEVSFKSNLLYNRGTGPRAIATGMVELGALCRISRDLHVALTGGPLTSVGVAALPYDLPEEQSTPLAKVGPLGAGVALRVVAKDKLHLGAESNLNMAVDDAPQSYNVLSNKLRVRWNIGGVPRETGGVPFGLGADAGINYYFKTDSGAGQPTNAVEGRVTGSAAIAW